MSIEDTVDECGDHMLMKRTPGGQLTFVGFNEETIDHFPNFKVREDDVFQCSYPKAGCHWVVEIINLMLKDNLSDPDARDKEHGMVENNSEDALEKIPSPRVLNNHFPGSYQPKQLLDEKKGKVVYIYRNIKDIAVSYYHHNLKLSQFNKYDAPFSNFLKRLVSGLLDCDISPFDYMKGWDERLKSMGSQAIVMCYEDMKEDLMPHLRRLAEFLNVSTDDDKLLKIAELTDIGSMRTRKSKKAMSILVDEQGNHMMYRKGQVGDWKNYFTVAESEWFDQVIKEKMGDLTFHQFRYEL